MNLQRERAHELVGEIAPLLRAHHAEVAAFPEIQLEPDIERYCALEDVGVLRCYTAREDSVLIGYAVFMVATNPHYASSKQATSDTVYVSPAYRDGDRGVSLLRFADEQLAQEGVSVVYQHVSTARDFGPVLTRRLGYKPVAAVYAKRMVA